ISGSPSKDCSTPLTLSCYHFLAPAQNACNRNELRPTTSLPSLITAGSRPPIALGIQMRSFFHLQNHRRKILLCSFVRLPRIDLKSSARCGHSRPNGSREIENQPEILVH